METNTFCTLVLQFMSFSSCNVSKPPLYVRVISHVEGETLAGVCDIKRHKHAVAIMFIGQDVIYYIHKKTTEYVNRHALQSQYCTVFAV